MLEYKQLGLTMTSYFDHSKVLMSNLLSTGELSDVTLVSDDQVKIQAHKFMLMYYSPVFQNILASNNETSNISNSILYLRGINHEELKPILEFIYNGQTVCHQEKIPRFLKVAKDLQIKEMDGDISKDKDCNLEVEIETKNRMNENNATEIEHEDIDYYDKSVSDQPTDTEDGHNEETADENIDQVMEEEKKTFHCPECDSIFTNFNTMQQHYRIKHKNRKQQCTFCDYRTSSSSHLYRHIRSIHEQMQHYCDFCDYKATRKDTLNVHIRKQHSNQ